MWCYCSNFTPGDVGTALSVSSGGANGSMPELSATALPVLEGKRVKSTGCNYVHYCTIHMRYVFGTSYLNILVFRENWEWDMLKKCQLKETILRITDCIISSAQFSARRELCSL